MFGTLVRRVATILAMLLVCGGASTASAADTGKPTKLELAIGVSREMMTAVDFKQLVATSVTNAPNNEMFAMEPEWKPLLVEAFRVQLDRDEDFLLTLIGKEIATKFSEEELTVGQLILRDPSMQAILRNAIKGQTESLPPPSKELRRLLGTPAGQYFVLKLRTSNDFLKPVQSRLIAGVMPGVLREFGERAGALEASRRVREGLPASKP